MPIGVNEAMELFAKLSFARSVPSKERVILLTLSINTLSNIVCLSVLILLLTSRNTEPKS